MTRLTSICLIALLASHFPAVLSESKQNDTDGKEKAAVGKKEMESIVEQKTSQAIKKLEKQLKSTFMAYSSANDQGKKQNAYEKLEHFVNIVKRDAKVNLEKSVKGFKFDVIRLSDKETESALETAYTRKKRSKTWGSCKPVCKQRCLPTCNLVCCIAPPYDVSRQMVKKIEKQLGKKYVRKKSTIKKHAKKKSTIKKHEQKKNSTVKKEKTEIGGLCVAKCQKACLPSCEFRCCIAPEKH